MTDVESFELLEPAAGLRIAGGGGFAGSRGVAAAVAVAGIVVVVTAGDEGGHTGGDADGARAFEESSTV